MVNIYQSQKIKRQIRVRAKIKGTSSCPRLSVFKSNKYLYVQLIDDSKRKTILGLSFKNLKETKGLKRMEKAGLLGKLIAEKALKLKISRVIFDRGSYCYHGLVKNVAEGAREGGLKF